MGNNQKKRVAKESVRAAIHVPAIASANSRRCWRVTSANPPHNGALTRVINGTSPDNSPIWLVENPRRA